MALQCGIVGLPNVGKSVSYTHLAVDIAHQIGRQLGMVLRRIEIDHFVARTALDDDVAQRFGFSTA